MGIKAEDMKINIFGNSNKGPTLAYIRCLDQMKNINLKMTTTDELRIVTCLNADEAKWTVL